MGGAEMSMLMEAVAYYRSHEQDPGYQGVYEERYCRGFAEYMGGGYADAVASGTAAIFVALAALQLPKGSDVLVSPITDPGTISAIILNGLRPKLVDSEQGSFNVSADTIGDRIDESTSAILVVHNFGRAADMEPIMQLSESSGLPVLEDCSQSHGAKSSGRKVGSFGSIAAFSTMYRKIHMTGGSGGVVYSQDLALHHLALAHADRGKPRWREGFDDRDPRAFLFPALNLHTDELSCAIGIASLARLDETIHQRRTFVRLLASHLGDGGGRFSSWLTGEDDAPFVAPIIVSGPSTSEGKVRMAQRLQEVGVSLNPDYHYLVRDWPWAAEYLADGFSTPNARDALSRTFFVYLNENYGKQQADFIADSILSLSDV